jgi:site-specific recombinase XerD
MSNHSSRRPSEIADRPLTDPRTSIQQAMTLFLDHRRAKGVTNESRALYTRVLMQWYDWHTTIRGGSELVDVAMSDVCAFFVYLREEHVIHDGNVYGPKHKRRGYAASSIESYYRVLRAFWHFCDAEELLTPAQARFFARGRIPRPKVPKRLRPAADRSLVDQLLNGIDDDGRERTILLRVTILLLYESGLRVSELCSLTDNDLAIRERAARVIGKGDVERWVFWSDRAHSPETIFAATARPGWWAAPSCLFPSQQWRTIDP